MKINFIAAVFLTAALALGGCVAESVDVTEIQDRQPDDSMRLGRTVVQALCESDAPEFVGSMPDEIRKSFGEKEFKAAYNRVDSQLGKPWKFEFLTRLRHPLFDVQVWRITFKRDSADGKTEIEQDAMFQVIIGQENDKPRVFSFGFL